MFHTRLLPQLQTAVFMSREYTPPPSARVGRRLPENQQKQLEDEMRRAIQEKNVQLGRARAQDGNPTILVLDTEDFSSINEQLVGHAFATACASVDHSNIDEVYSFHRHTDNFLVLPLKCLGTLFPDPPRWREFRRAHAVILWNESQFGPPYLQFEL
jgi:hypothetical protein